MKKRASILTLIILNMLVYSQLIGAQYSIWEIGKRDQSGAEFSLYTESFREYQQKYPQSILTYEIGKSKSIDIPYVFPGPQDAWGGGKNTQLVIRFGVDQVEVDIPLNLHLRFMESHPSSPPRLDVTFNNYMEEISVPKGSNSSFLTDKKIVADNLSVDLTIPAGTLQNGENLLIISSEGGSWLTWDQIELTAATSVKLGKTSSNFSLLKTEVIPALMYGKENKLYQPVKFFINNWSGKSQTIELYTGSTLLEKQTISKGLNEIEVQLPETSQVKDIPVRVVSGKEMIAETKVKQTPVNKWTVYLVQHTHTDIGYTKPQTEILTEHLRYIDYAIEYCELTENYPEDAKFRWSCEAAWAVYEYLKCRPAEQIEKLRKYIDKGQIEVTAMFFNMSEIVDENSLKAFLEPIKEFRKHNLPVQAGMQNDVNGIAWALADYLPDLGVKYIAIGEHGHRALIPFDMPTVFKWESPSGKPIYTYRADHYMTGNFFGLEQGDPHHITTRLFGYLKDLEDKNYPHDAVAVQYSGYFTDNSPPSIIGADLIKEWNKMYAYPKLRSAVVSEFMDYITENYESELPVYRVAYPDWWTDGFGSAARETAASRKTHSDMITIEGMLSMANLKGKALPQDTNDKIRHIHERLLFYDEHTFGAAESIRDPMAENSQVQWAEKSAYVWEGLKSAQMLYETSAGLLQNDLSRGDAPTITFFNTLNWERSGLITVYIDFEVIPRNTPFRIVDEKGNTLKVQALRSRDEGIYYGIYAESIPAMGYKTYQIKIDQSVGRTIVARQEYSRSLLNTQEGRSQMENQYYRLQIDPVKGTVESLFDKQLQLEIVDTDSPWLLGAFVYEKLANRWQMERYTLTDYERNGLYDIQLTGYVKGSVYQSIELEGKSDCCEEGFGVKTEIRLFNDEKRIELHYAIKRLPETDPTGIYVAFPFQLENAKLSFEVQGGLLTSGENQLTGTASDWNTVQNFVIARNDKAQFIVGSDLAPLFEMGGITTGLYQYQKSYEYPHVYSFVMNNYWTTNFRAFQDGEFRWSYYLTSSEDTSNTYATRFGWSSRVPLYARVMPVGKPNSNPMEYSAFHINQENLLMTSCTLSEKEGYVLLNIRELDGKATQLSILDNQNRPIPFTQVNAIGENMGATVANMELIPYQNIFVELKNN